jgi:hypothetical protein
MFYALFIIVGVILGVAVMALVNPAVLDKPVENVKSIINKVTGK